MRAWLLTNTTYGTWLPGDPRGSPLQLRIADTAPHIGKRDLSAPSGGVLDKKLGHRLDQTTNAHLADCIPKFDRQVFTVSRLVHVPLPHHRTIA